jgi:hypothetical protein
MKFKGWFLSVLCCSTFQMAQALTPGLRAGITLGATYTKLPTTTSTQSGLGYPLMGVAAVASAGMVGIRTYVESQKFITNYAYTYSGYQYSVGNTTDMITVAGLPTVYFGKFYLGMGGGLGFYKYAGGHSGYPWLIGVLGVEISRYFFIEVRPQFDVNSPKIFDSMYMPISLGLLFFDAK